MSTIQERLARMRQDADTAEKEPEQNDIQQRLSAMRQDAQTERAMIPNSGDRLMDLALETVNNRAGVSRVAPGMPGGGGRGYSTVADLDPATATPGDYMAAIARDQQRTYADMVTPDNSPLEVQRRETNRAFRTANAFLPLEGGAPEAWDTYNDLYDKAVEEDQKLKAMGGTAARELPITIPKNLASGAVGAARGLVNEAGYIAQGATKAQLDENAEMWRRMGREDYAQDMEETRDAQGDFQSWAQFGQPFIQDVAEETSGYGKVGRALGNVAQGVGGMVPSILSNLVVPGSGLPVMFLQASGNATEEAKAAGASDDAAALYGTAVGAVEVLTEKMFGGIPGLGVGALDDAVENAIKRGVGNEATQRALLFLVDALGEGVEEFTSEFGDYFLDKWLVKNDERTLGEVGKDALYSFLIGALTSVAMQAPVEVANMAKTQRGREQLAQIVADQVDQQIEQPSVQQTEMPPAAEQQQPAQPITQAMLRSIAADPEQLAQMGIDARGKTNSQIREEIRAMLLADRAAQDQAQRTSALAHEMRSKPSELGWYGQPSSDPVAGQNWYNQQTSQEAEERASEPVSTWYGPQSTESVAGQTWYTPSNDRLYQLAQEVANERVAQAAAEASAVSNAERAAALPMATQQVAPAAQEPAAPVKTTPAPGTPAQAQIKPAVRGVNPGLNMESVKQSNARLTRAEMRGMDAFGKMLGVEILMRNEILDEDGKRSGAQGRLKDGTIQISTKAKDPYLTVAVHEVVHRIRELSPESYDSLLKVVRNNLGEEGMRSSELLRSLGYDEGTDLTEEVVADAFGIMQGDERFIRQFVQEDRNAAQKFLDALHDMLVKIQRALSGGPKLDPAQRAEFSALENKLITMSAVFEDALKTASEAYETNGGKPAPAEISSDFAEAKYSVAPPYRPNSAALENWVKEMSDEASETYSLFNDVNQIGGDVSRRFMLPSEWNEKVRTDKAFAETARKIAERVPENIRKNAHINEDGTITETAFEKEFRMERSMMQRLVDSLPMETIPSTVESNGKRIRISEKGKVNTVGGEAYRRALLDERRKMYREGRLPTKSISGLSKDTWGAMGFLATNGKTGASGDFTTLCPQMYYNKGCFYCYRRAALTTGVNNKLVGENVWYTGEVLQLKQGDIDNLNKNGGLRIQSFGDWMEQYSSQLADLLMDAEEVGLQVKIITKEPSLIDTVALLRDQGIGKNLYFNLSTDYTIEEQGTINNQNGDGAQPRNPLRPYMTQEDGRTFWKRALSVEEANEYRKKYPWVNTRIVATTVDEFLEGLRSPMVDVVTGYHGNIRQFERVSSATGETLLQVEALGDAGMPRFAFNQKTGQWTLEYEGKTATHKKLAKAIEDAGLQMQYYIKSCCITGRCATCEGKCGKVARDFNVKNATNADKQSVAYWQKHMTSAEDNPLLLEQMEDAQAKALLNAELDRGKYSKSTKDLMQMDTDEQSIRTLRETIHNLEEKIELSDVNGITAAERRVLENKLVKANAEMDKLIAKERSLSKRTSIDDIIKNLKSYRRSDLESLAEQVSDGAWDDYEDLSDSDLRDALLETLNERAQEMTVLERQAPKYGYYVRPAQMTASLQGNKDTRYSKSTKELLEAYAEQYGAIKPGEKPARDVTIPKRTTPKTKVGQTIRSIAEAPATPEKVLPTVEELVANGEFDYPPYGDEAALSNANRFIAKRDGDFNKAYVDWASGVKSGKVSKTNTAIGWVLYNNAVNSGDTKTSVDIMLLMAQHQRSAGQAVQATRILKKLSPEWQLYTLAQTVLDIEEELRNRYGDLVPNLEIDEDLVKLYKKAETDEERNNIMELLKEDIARQMPTTFLDRWTAWRYTAMLGNVRTIGRNIAGNLGFAPVVWTKDAIATAIEAAASAATGGKFERTKGNIIGRGDLLKAAWDDYANVMDEAMGEPKYSTERQAARADIDKYKKVFGNTKSKAWNKTGGRVLEGWRVGTGKAMNSTDVWFNKPQYVLAMAQYCAANGISAEQIRSGKGLDKARDYAITEAQKATYRDTNDFSQMVSSLGKSWLHSENKWKRGIATLGEGVLPFRKTPANILARGVEYSPIGLLKAISYDAVQVKKGNMSAADMIDDISAGLTGTGLLALGVFLASQGLLRGRGRGDDKKKEFADLEGHQDYALEIGDTSITLDWLAPEALPVFIGANLWEAAADRKDGMQMKDILTAISNVSEPMLQMSMLQSLNDLLDGNAYGNEETSALMRKLSSAATSYLTQAFPTLLGQVERTGEGKRMTTYTDKNGFLTGDMQYILGKISAKIPGWDFQQIPYIDAWGREELTGKYLERAGQNFVNPSFVSKIVESDMEKELERLYDSTGESVFPQRAAKYFNVDGERKDLSAKEYVTYATEKGRTSYTVVGGMVGSDLYKGLSDAEKADCVKDAYSYADQTARTAVGGKISDSWVQKAQAGVSKGIKPEAFILARNAVSDVEGIKDKNGSTISNSAGLKKMQIIYSIPGLTYDQRKYLFECFGVGKTVIGYNKALVDQKIKEMKQK